MFLPPIDPRPTGVGVYVLELCRRLGELNPDIVFFSERAGDLPAPLADHRHLTPPPRRLTRVLPARVQRRLALDLWLPSQLVRSGVNALLVPFHDGTRRRHCGQAVVVHDLTIEHFPEGFRRSVRSYHRRVARPIIRRSDRVIAVSENTATDLVERWQLDPAGIQVIHEGYDRELFRPASDEEIERARRTHGLTARYLLYCGTLARHKNLQVVLRALARLTETAPQLRFALGGRSDVGDRRSLEVLARRLGLADRIDWLGFVDRRDLGPLMSGAAAFVFPSLYEGFGLAPLEAMACGTRVLASRAGALPEVVGEGGVLLEPGDAEAWAQAIQTTLEGHREGRTADWQQLAQARAARFDWDECARQVLATLSQVARPASALPATNEETSR